MSELVNRSRILKLPNTIKGIQQMMPSNKQGQLKETKVSEFEAIIGSK